MRIRRSAARLLGSAYPAPAPPQSEHPPPPPPVRQPCSSRAGGGGFTAGGASSAEAERCELSRSPWELMAQLDPSDPKEVELFMGRYFVSVACRTNWLFQASIDLAASIKGEEQDDWKEEHLAGDMVAEVFAKRQHKVAKKKVAEKTVMENRGDDKFVWGLKKSTEIQSEDDDFVAAGGELWLCKKNDGKRRFCRRPVSQPDSLCVYHSDPKYAPPPASSAASKLSSSSKPRKRRRVDAGEGYLYYAGFGPSLGKRQRSSSSVLESVPAEQKEEAQLPEEHAAAPAQTDDADNQAASAHVDEPRCDEMAGIAGGDEESSDDALGCNDEPRVVGVKGNIKRKSPFKKRWRKPVKARSLKSLMC
ncbi:uncharacterized protein LOC123402302 [Hordeum vulgare subsp. vulgare]|uniref:WRC domain-containing protein n=1 Tax=Hordeum vulgare subsp. vulgare TaxID=112509 RepID=A0A8I6WMV0_HORVV|nr:uncharacterized protein LOC123402302 [Hordeum vulgare subsp. vulgare]